MNVLIFDDSPSAVIDIQLKVQSILPHVQINRALNYDGAVNVLENHQVDLAFVDLSMPDKNGMDFISEIIQPNPAYNQIPIIVITAVKPDSLLSSALEGKVSCYLVKPVSALELQVAIDQALKPKAPSVEQ